MFFILYFSPILLSTLFPADTFLLIIILKQVSSLFFTHCHFVAEFYDNSTAKFIGKDNKCLSSYIRRTIYRRIVPATIVRKRTSPTLSLACENVFICPGNGAFQKRLTPGEQFGKGGRRGGGGGGGIRGNG